MLIAIVPFVPGFRSGHELASLLPEGDALASECTTNCRNYDELIKSWSNVHARLMRHRTPPVFRRI
jgi:hypothetical protein